jgi:predicted nuclease of restriction endonuclease-like (RecB) superfamily
MLTPEYASVLAALKTRIRAAQLEAARASNRILLELYWYIGETIVHKQQELGWGKSVVEQLAADLQAEFPGANGFSARNLWLMRQFYDTYAGNEILQPLVAELGWAHNLQIMSKCKGDREREFYLRMARKFGWTKAVLIHQIEGNSYQKYLANQTNFDDTLPEQYRDQAILAGKGEYLLFFIKTFPKIFIIWRLNDSPL